MKKNVKKMLVFIIPAIILILFLTYHDNAFVSSLKENNTPDISPETVSGTATGVAFMPEVNTEQPSQSTQAPKTNKKSKNKKNKEENNEQNLDIQKENDYPDEIKKGELVSVDRLFNVKTNAFYYIGMTCTSYSNGSKMDICTWEVANLCKYPLKMNINIHFYDENKNEIGSYKITKTLKKTTYNEDSEQDWQDETKIDKGQSCSVRMSVPATALKAGYLFSDVAYVSIHDIKKAKKPKPTTEPVATEEAEATSQPEAATGKEIELTNTHRQACGVV